MKVLLKLLIPIAVSTAALGIVALMLPLGAEASNDSIYKPEEIILAQGCIYCNKKDIQLSGLGGKLPEVAANGSFVAVVYEQNNAIFLRAVDQSDGAWQGISKAVHSTGGNTPKLAFDTRSGITNTVHVVWAGFNPGNNQAIRHAVCSLTATSASCPVVDTIATAAGNNLFNPAIAIQNLTASTQRIHVAWYDSSVQKIKTAYSDNDGASWTPGSLVMDVTGSTNVGKPALAVSDNGVHVAYLSNNGGTDWYVNYRRMAFDHNSTSLAAKQYGSDGGVNENVSGFGAIENVDIAATNAAVFLIWDNRHLTVETDKYGLTGVQNADNGSSGSWDLLKPLHITSTNPANPTEPAGNGNRKLSKGTTSAPPEENALRPSVTTSGGNFVVVWQQRPSDSCDEDIFGGGANVKDNSSEIYFGDNSGNSWGSYGILTDTTKAASLYQYSIDPDIAVDSGGNHFVFMKDAITHLLCNGGSQNDYAVYYRGPYESVKAGSGGIFLPLLIKN